MKETWQDLASAYLRGRPTLKRVCLLIDSRHGVKDADRETMKNLDSAAVSYQLVLTKTDQLKAGRRRRAPSRRPRRSRASTAPPIPRCCRPAARPASASRAAAEIAAQGCARPRALARLLRRAGPRGSEVNPGYAASWKMMPRVKRSPSRRLDTPWRMAVR